MPIRRLICLLIAALCLCTVAAAAAPDYKIRRYELNITPDFAQKSLRIATTIRIANPGLLDTFEFGLGDEYKIDSVKVNNAPAEFTAKDRVLTVKLAKPVNDVVLSVSTTGSPTRSHDESAAVIDDNSLFLLWSDRFYPIDYDHWSPVRTTITLPADMKIIAPGHMVRSEEINGAHRVVFETAQPTVCFSIFADRRWVRRERVVNGIKILTLLHPEQDKFSEQIFETSGDVLKFFTELHGYYPAEQFAFVTVAGMRGRRALNGYIAYGPPFLDREMERVGYDAHETSLLWWGYATRGSGPGAFQWNEGFGDYVEFLYSQSRRKPLPAVFDRFRNEYLSTPSDQEPLYTGLRGNTPQKFVHGKYPWLMAVLHDYIGDASFRRGLRSLFVNHRHTTYTIQDLIQHFEQASGTSLSWWREQWLERRGVPEVSVQFSKESGRQKVTNPPTRPGWSLRGTLTQHGPVYTIPLELGVRTDGGMEIIRVQASKQTTDFRWSGKSEPLEVVIDPNKRLLLRVKQ